MQTVTVYDKGPSDEPYAEPVATVMATVDAKQAVAADPDRYSMDPIAPHVPNLGLEDRVTLLERRLDALEGDVDEVPPPDHPPPPPDYPPPAPQGTEFAEAKPAKALSPKAKE